MSSSPASSLDGLSPVNRLLAVFSPPPQVTDPDAKKLGWVFFAVGLAVLTLGVSILSFIGHLSPHSQLYRQFRGEGGASKVFFWAVMGPAGLGYVLVPAGLFRGLLGVSGKGLAVRMLRKLFGFVLFCVTVMGSFVVLGFLTRS